MKKTLLVLFAVVAMAVLCMGMAFFASAEEPIESGTLGENLTWELKPSTGELVISGEGEMASVPYGTAWRVESVYDSGIKKITVEEGVTSIADEAFFACSATEVFLPNSLKKIGASAFYDCDVTEIIIPDGVTEIGENAFRSSSLERITIPKSVKRIGKDAFSLCLDLTYVNITDLESWSQIEFANEEATPLGRVKKLHLNGTLVTEWVVPETVEVIEDYAFYYCQSLKSVTFSKGLRSIGNGAFYECAGLTSIEIPDGVTGVGAYAFAFCTELESVTLPGSVTTVGKYPFLGCEKIASATLHADAIPLLPAYSQALQTVVITGGESIGENAFSSCENLTSVVLPNGITSIGQNAFYDCKKLSSISIPQSVVTISSYAFHGCVSLESIVIPNGVKAVNAFTFNGCISLASVSLPDSLERIEMGAFGGCVALQQFDLPKSLSYIGSSAFVGCSGLVRVVIPPCVTKIESSAFADCANVTHVTIPNTVSSVSNTAFSGCPNIVSMTIPANFDLPYQVKETLQTIELNGGTSIKNFKFYEYTALTHVVISDSVTSIEMYAFYGCSNLESLLYCGTEEQWNAVKKGTSWDYETGSFTLSFHAHAWDSGVEVTSPTHLNEGRVLFTCSECNRTKIDLLDKVGDHVFDEGVITLAPTHTVEGVRTYTCECGEKKTETVEKTPEHTYGDWIRHDAEKHKKVCACGNVLEYADHEWDNGVITTEATHTAEGVRDYTCECGEKKTETVEKTPEHTYGDWVRHDAEKHKKVCACGDAQYADHAWNDGAVTQAPTQTEEGVKAFTCSVCSETKTEVIEKLPAETKPSVTTPTEAPTSENKPSATVSDDENASDTSSSSGGCGSVLSGGAVLLALVCGAGGLIICKKRED